MKFDQLIRPILVASMMLFLCSGYLLHSQNSKTSVWGKQGYDLPIVDLDGKLKIQTVVDKEEGQYLVHPSTLLLDDGTRRKNMG